MQSYSPLILTSQSVLKTKANKDDVEFRFNLLQPRSQGPLSSPLGEVTWLRLVTCLPEKLSRGSTLPTAFFVLQRHVISCNQSPSSKEE